MKTIKLKQKVIYNLTRNFLNETGLTIGIGVVWTLLIGPFITYQGDWAVAGVFFY